MAFNENTRVKIPAILHLCKLDYKYLSLSKSKWDKNTNIFTDVFYESIAKINSGIEQGDIKKELEKIYLALDNEDLGEAFYKMLTATSGVKLIDFHDFKNNSFHVVTELPYKNGDEEFRPDITLLINGMPLAFVEVKKPNNKDGIKAERDRINARFQNKKFRKFINLSQILVFSNNMEYDSESHELIQGAFYASSSYNEAHFNYFREEEELDLSKILKSSDEEMENFVLKDNNLVSIKNSPEFITNKEVNTPTNRILTSLFSKDRIAFILKYCIAYVSEESGKEKHIMRYQQIFATKAIEKTLDKGIKKGIIWHTQGSGKTALAFYNVKFLIDFFQKKKIIPKFYFIVDRLDLMEQASREFTNRGLYVHRVNSKDELLENFKSKTAVHNLQGKREITVVNIQKFKDDTDILHSNDYDINSQRIYFLDEVHRSYNPKGSFLANLITSDRNAILIGLSGTPLIGNSRRSKDVFGDYIHKYYYNSSIADGYTLRLIREEIEGTHKKLLEERLRQIEIQEGNIKKRTLFSRKKFVEPMLDYIVEDFINSRIMHNDNTIGGMVVCDSSDQAKEMADIFKRKYANKLKSTLILHDIGTKEDRKNYVEDFKNGKIDLIFVYNMLLTGFDAKRLKKIYIGRIIKNHNLLQTLTRVNRPYHNFRFGYVVDFADILQEFKVTNEAYLEELQLELGDEMSNYSNLFMSKEEIESEIANIKEKLFSFDLKNSEIFSRQITEIKDRKEVLEIKKALETVKNLYNTIRLRGDYDLLEKIDFKKLKKLYIETVNHLNVLNLKESLEKNVDTSNLLNIALEDIFFMFYKTDEKELLIADKLKDTQRKTRQELLKNFDSKDKEWVSLYDELMRLFKENNLNEITQEEMKNNTISLQQIYDRAKALNSKNDRLKEKYLKDEKYVRLHKRIAERGGIFNGESVTHETLMYIKKQTDEKILINTRMLDNEGYFMQLMNPVIVNGFEKHKTKIDLKSAGFINSYLVKEYINEFNGKTKW